MIFAQYFDYWKVSEKFPRVTLGGSIICCDTDNLSIITQSVGQYALYDSQHGITVSGLTYDYDYLETLLAYLQFPELFL